MKTIDSGFLTHLQGESTKAAILVKVTRTDGLIFGLTGHDRPLRYPPGSSGLLYETGAAAPQLASIVRSAGINVDNTEIEGSISTVVEIDDIEAGDWASARLELFRVDWENLSLGDEPMGVGELGQISHDGRGFRVEFMGRTHKLGRTITRNYLPTCDADLGDERCTVDIESLAVNGTVSAVVDQRNFTADDILSAAQFHTYGRLTWLTGENAGRQMEVKEQLAGGVFELQLGMKRAIAVGDTLRAYPGCNKLKKTGLGEYLGDCVVKFDNALNFRGFDEVPGIDKIVRPAGV